MSTTTEHQPGTNGTGGAMAIATTEQPPRREIRVVEDHGPLAFILDTARFEHLQRIAQLMASASLIPDHLRGKGKDENAISRQTIGNCFLVVDQSFRWGFDPFAVAPETYSVGGKLAFQGKLIAAVVNSRAGLDGRLDYEFFGVGDQRGVIVRGRFKGEASHKEIQVTVAQAKTSNDMWRKDPDQKLCYTGAIKWARRFCPEVVLGVLTDDDVDRMAERQAPSGTLITSREQLQDLIGDTGHEPSKAIEVAVETPDTTSEPKNEPAPPTDVLAGYREKVAQARATKDADALYRIHDESEADERLTADEKAEIERACAEAIKASGRGPGSNKQKTMV